LAPGGLTLYFAQFHSQMPARAIMVATRQTPTSNFGSAKLLGGANSPTLLPFEISIAQTSDGLYVSEQQLGSEDASIWVSSKVDGGYTMPVQLWPAAFDEHAPAISRDELSLFFAGKPWNTGSLMNDIWVVNRSPMSQWG